MGLAEVLTIIFVVLKLTGVIGWSWWYVLLPEIIAVSIYLLLFIAWLFICFMAWREQKNFKKKFWKASRHTRR